MHRQPPKQAVTPQCGVNPRIGLPCYRFELLEFAEIEQQTAVSQECLADIVAARFNGQASTLPQGL